MLQRINNAPKSTYLRADQQTRQQHKHLNKKHLQNIFKQFLSPWLILYIIVQVLFRTGTAQNS
jgi:hypothetical protein